MLFICYLFQPRTSKICTTVATLTAMSEPWLLITDGVEDLPKLHYVIEMAKQNLLHSFAMAYDCWPDVAPEVLHVIKRSVNANGGRIMYV